MPRPKELIRPSKDVLVDLYEVQRLTTRQIASQFNVKHISVLRWLKYYDIPRRAASCGLAYRDVDPPTAEELNQMLHVDCIGYRGVAEKYDVHYSAVKYWCDKLEVPRPGIWQTRLRGEVPEIDDQKVKELYESGVSIKDIAKQLGIGQWHARQACKRTGVTVKKDGFNGGIRYTCQNGLEVRSVYEQKVADWFIENNVRFDYEPSYPFHKKWHADFHANGWYVEVWGVVGSESYEKKKQRKIELCEKNKIPLLQLKPHQFSAEQGYLMGKALSAVFEPPEIQGLLF